MREIRALAPPDRSRAVRDGLLLAGVIFNATFLLFWTGRFDFFVDVHSWATINLGHLYAQAAPSLAVVGAFRYAPVIAWLFFPATLASWPVLVAAYVTLSGVALWLLAGRRALILLVAFPPVLLELLNGNIHLFMALAIVVGLRRPAAWAFILLTKVTPGIGLLWFAARGEWRNLATAAGTTVAIAAVGLLIAPALWLQWFGLLGAWSSMAVPSIVPPLVLRLPVAAALAWYAGRTDRAWLVPVACTLALPTIWLQGTAVLTACFPLWWERARFQRGVAPSASTTPAPAAPLRVGDPA